MSGKQFFLDGNEGVTETSGQAAGLQIFKGRLDPRALGNFS
jgi:hypothetical protein